MISRPSPKQLKKIEKYLAPGEEIIHLTGISNRYFFLSLLYLFPLALVLIGLKPLFHLIDLRKTKVYLFTNRRVMIRTGYFSYKIDSAPYDKISHLIVHEPFFHRLFFAAGDLILHTAGPTPLELRIEKVAFPVKIKNLIENLIIKERHLTQLNQTESQFPSSSWKKLI